MPSHPRTPTRDWADLSRDLLTLILHHLPAPDCFTFTQVCKSWQSILLPNRPPPVKLLVSTINNSISINLSIGHLTLRSSPPTFTPTQHIVGSSMGWLVIASSCFPGMHLLNPLSNHRIPLPLRTSGGTPMRASGHISTTSIFNPPQNDSCFRVNCVVLSSAPGCGDCVLVGTGRVMSSRACFAWCRPGDRKWAIFRNLGVFYIKDLMFHKGKLYLLGDYGDLLIYAFDPRPTKRGSVACFDEDPSFMFRRLVGAGEDLLAIVWQCEETPESVKVDVFLHVFKVEGDKWVKVESLGDRVLLIGGLSAESFGMKDLLGLGFEPNCVYCQSCKYSMSDGRRQIRGFLDEEPRIEWIAPQTWAKNLTWKAEAEEPQLKRIFNENSTYLPFAFFLIAVVVQVLFWDLKNKYFS